MTDTPSMASLPEDLALRYRRQNWWSDRIAAMAESLFLLAAALSFAAVAGYLSLPLLDGARERLVLWPLGLQLALALALGAGSAWVAGGEQRRLRVEQAGDWLAAQPIPVAVRTGFRRRRAWIKGAASLCIVGLCLAFLRDSRLAIAALFAFLALTPLALRMRAPAAAPRLRSAAAVDGERRGLQILGASLEPASRRWPHTARFAAAALLLVPIGAGPLLVVGLLIAISAARALADLVAHYATRLRECDAWLGAQPLAPMRLLRAFAPTLLRRAALLIAAILMVLALSPMPHWLLAIVAPLLVAATAHAILLTHVERRDTIRRRRLGLIHATTLLVCAQLMPPLALLLWIAMLIDLWRRRHD